MVVCPALGKRLLLLPLLLLLVLLLLPLVLLLPLLLLSLLLLLLLLLLSLLLLLLLLLLLFLGPTQTPAPLMLMSLFQRSLRRTVTSVHYFQNSASCIVISEALFHTAHFWKVNYNCSNVSPRWYV